MRKLLDGYAVIDSVRNVIIAQYKDFEDAFEASEPGTYVMNSKRYHDIYSPPLRGGRVAPAGGGSTQ